MGSLAISVATGTPSFRQRTTLDGREYILVFRWSQREERWYLDVLDAQENLLAGAIKIVANWPLLESRRFAAGMPPGEIVALDRRSVAADPGLDELGALVPLLYFPAADMAAARAVVG